MGPVPIMATKPQQEMEVIESWEDIEETDEIDNKFNKLITPSKCLESQSSQSIDGKPVQIILTGDDALRTQYVPPEPTVKILKRPPKDTQSSINSKNFLPKKTLEQREQAYAEARLRILGEATPEKTEERISIVKPDKIKSSETEFVIRQPRGPDGTNGFNLRR